MTVDATELVRDWIARREPAAPPALAERIANALGTTSTGAASGDGAALIVETCLAAAETLLARVLEEGGAARASALDLLAADALVTYAFEAASDEPALLPAAARAAMARLSRAAAVVHATSPAP